MIFIQKMLHVVIQDSAYAILNFTVHMKTKINRSFHVIEFDIMELAGLMVGDML